MKLSLFVLLIMMLLHQAGTSQQRVFTQMDFEVISEVLLSEHEIFRPNLLDINENGDIVFFDFADFKIVKKNISEDEFMYFGDGRGRGPREFEMVFDLKILDDGMIYLVDIDKRKVIKWDTEGKYLGQMESGGKSVSPARFAVCEGSKDMYILSSQYNRKGILHQVNSKGKLKLTFEKKENVEQSLPFYTDGELDCDASGNLYYASRYVNSIKKYDNSGRLIFDIPIIEFIENEEIVEKNDNFFDLVKGVRRASGDVNHFGDQLYVAFSGNEDELLRMIDVYSDKSGEYLYSFKLPFHFQEVAINESYITVLREDEDEENYLITLSYQKNQ